jgi:hypothetical protein
VEAIGAVQRVDPCVGWYRGPCFKISQMLLIAAVCNLHSLYAQSLIPPATGLASSVRVPGKEPAVCCCVHTYPGTSCLAAVDGLN